MRDQLRERGGPGAHQRGSAVLGGAAPAVSPGIAASGEDGDLVARLADPAAPEVTTLVARVIDHLARLYPSFGRAAAVLDDDEFRPPRGGWVLVELGGQPVACGGVHPCGAVPGAAELKRIWVEPHARGRGISRLVLTRCELLAASLGYGEVYLDTGPRQREAMRLYETSGYRRIPSYSRNAAGTFTTSYAKRLA